MMTTAQPWPWPKPTRRTTVPSGQSASASRHRCCGFAARIKHPSTSGWPTFRWGRSSRPQARNRSPVCKPCWTRQKGSTLANPTDASRSQGLPRSQAQGARRAVCPYRLHPIPSRGRAGSLPYHRARPERDPSRRQCSAWQAGEQPQALRRGPSASHRHGRGPARVSEQGLQRPALPLHPPHRGREARGPQRQGAQGPCSQEGSGMKVSNSVEQGPFGKEYRLTAEIEGRRYEARHIWPAAYDNLNKADALALVERHLWYLLMGAIEDQLKGIANGKTQTQDSHPGH